jgi:hypothetical protein
MLEDLRRFKQDPDIRFEYEYMTDNASAKVIDKVMKQTKNSNGRTAEKGRCRQKEKKASSMSRCCSGSRHWLSASLCAVLCACRC